MYRRSSLLKPYLFPVNNQVINSKFLPKYRLPLIDRETSVERLSLSLFPSNNIYIKRDDQLDSYASGNKLRKLEFLFADILSRPKCQHIITAGSLHSNHCKAVACLAARFQRKAHVLLRTDRDKEDEQLLQGNVLLNYLFGAKLYLIPKKANIQRDIEPRMKQLEEELGGKDRCYSIPIGGSDIIGLFGYLDCFIREIVPLIDKLNLGHLVVPMSSGGTMEGLALGNYLTGNRLRIHAFAVSDNQNYFKTHFHTILNQLELNHLIELVDNDHLVNICDSYVGLGYGRMTNEQIELLHQVISETGILFDPVYTGKCLFGLYEELRNKRIDEKNILFLHTGGAIGLMNPDYGKQWLLSSNTHIRDWKIF
jgi:1-aminocyclopropane-1-carboxylate deaminase/D-cysteine desulfhydrase-like pyridoxal-dependent ACC family enzyme